MEFQGDVCFAPTPEGQVRSQEPPVSEDGGRLERQGWRRSKGETLGFQMTPPFLLKASTDLSSELFFRWNFQDALPEA